MGPGDYVTMAGGLFFHGLEKCPDVFHVISSRRHRNHVIDGRKIVFIHRKNHAADLLKNLVIYDGLVLTANPALCWLDFLANLEMAPDLSKLVKLAETLPIKVEKILEDAWAISRSAFKRACFLLAWVSRLNSFELVASRIDSVPVKIDFRQIDSVFLWEKRLKVLFPEDLLAVKLITIQKKKGGWGFFRNSAGFNNILVDCRQLILPADDFADEDFDGLLFPTSRINVSDMKSWLEFVGLYSLAEVFNTRDIKHLTPWLKKLFVKPESLAAFIESVLAESGEIAGNNDLIRVLLIVSSALGIEVLLVKLINLIASDALATGATSLFMLCFEKIADKSALLPVAGAVAAMTYAARGHGNLAKKVFPGNELKKASPGWFNFSMGALAYRIDNLKSAETYYKKAFKKFIDEGQLHTAILCRVYLGNYYLGNADYARARTVYRSTLANLGALEKKPDPLIALLKGNLGIAEFRTGNLEKAEHNLRFAVNRCRAVSFHGSRALFLSFLAVVECSKGCPGSALSRIRLAWESRERVQNVYFRYEILNLLLSLLQYSGKEKEADSVIKSLSRNDNIDKIIVRLARARKKLLTGHLVGLEDEFADLVKNSSDLEIRLFRQTALFYLAVVRLLGQKTISETMKDEILSFKLNQMSVETAAVAILQQFLRNGNLPDRPLSYSPAFIFLIPLLYKVEPDKVTEFFKPYIDKSSDFLRKTGRNFLAEGGVDLYALSSGKSRKTMLVTDCSIRTISGRVKEIEKRLLKEPDTFLFNGPALKLHFSGKVLKLRSGSAQYQLLCSLFKFQCEPVPIERLYTEVWQTEYDEDYDLQSVKSVISRLNKSMEAALGCIRTGISTYEGTKHISISLPQKWFAILPLNDQ